MDLILNRPQRSLLDLPLPALDGLQMWLAAEDWDGSQLPDRSSNGNNATVTGPASLSGQELTVPAGTFATFGSPINGGTLFLLVRDDGSLPNGGFPVSALLGSSLDFADVILFVTSAAGQDLSVDSTGNVVTASVVYNANDLGVGGNVGDGLLSGAGYKALEITFQSGDPSFNLLFRFFREGGVSRDFSGQFLSFLAYEGPMTPAALAQTRAYLNATYQDANF